MQVNSISSTQNKQQSFEMAFKPTNSAIKKVLELGTVDEFKAALPEIKEMAKDCDITLKRKMISMDEYPSDYLYITATPLNKMGLNNPITRIYYKLTNSYGIQKAHIDYLDNKKNFISIVKQAKSKLNENMKPKRQAIALKAEQKAIKSQNKAIAKEIQEILKNKS